MKPIQFYSFWSINDELDVGKINGQLEELKGAGLSGVIFHPRYYPNKPEYLGSEYMNRVSDIILYVKAIGMEFWIYDENGWPSGTAGGEVLRRHPGLRCRWLELAPATDRQPGQGRESAPAQESECILAFRGCSNGGEPETGDPEEYGIYMKTIHAVSSLDPTACEAFLELTHEQYKKCLKPEAFEYVTGFFSDEVAFLDGHSRAVDCGGVPWDDRLPLQYREKYGEDLLPLLPLLFIGGEGAETVRSRFWELLTDAINEGFYKPVKNWCEANGKLFTAHLKGEENPFFQVSYSGSCLEVLKHVTLPAVDALERVPGNNYFPRIAKSVSSQFYNGECLAEAMGGAGWGASPETFENYMLWLAGHGMTHIVLHLNQMRLNTQAIHDWPPSTPCHMTWKEAFPAVLAEINRKAAELPDLNKQPELLVVTPARGVMARFIPRQAMQINEHNGTNLPETPAGRISEEFISLVEECHQAGIRYELTEERAVEELGKVEGGFFRIGKRKYDRLLIANGCRWTACGEQMLEALADGDVAILKPETWRNHFEELHPPSTEDYSEVGEGSAINPANNPSINPANYRRINLKQDELLAGSLTNVLFVKQEPWIVEEPEDNLLFIEWNTGMADASADDSEQTGFSPVETGLLGYTLMIEDKGKLTGLQLICMDEIDSAAVNGTAVDGHFAEDKHIFEVPAVSLKEGMNTFQIRTIPGGEKNPVTFLKGSFSIRSLTEYKDKEIRQVATEGPFVLAPYTELSVGNLIETGLPFCGSPVTLRKCIFLEHSVECCSIRLTEVHGDGAEVFVDGKEEGWVWGPEWTVDIPYKLSQGSHELVVRLVPSTFNVYGPHRHRDGDRHLTSPAQYEGIKNFADRSDAPEHTHCGEWSFVKFGIGEQIQLLQSKEN